MNSLFSSGAEIKTNLSHELPILNHDFANALKRLSLNVRVVVTNHVHHHFLAVQFAYDDAAVGVEARELSEIVEGDLYDVL